MNRMPNILWFCADQQRYDTIHALGNPYIDTPNLDRLCAQGTALSCAYVQNPVCTPSRASFLSGRYPSAINANILGGENLPEHCTLITKALADAGYHCGNIGKLHISSAWGGHEKRGEDGYAEFIYSLGSGHDLENGCSAYKDWLDKQGVDWRTLFTNDGQHDYYWYREDAPVDLRQTAWCAKTAIDFIRRNRQKPWMLSVNCFDPHPPYDAPLAYVEKYLSRGLPDPVFNDYDRRLGEVLRDVRHQTAVPQPPDDTLRRQRASYYGMCEIVDRHLGWIIEALEEMELREDTLIIFTSDHGEMLGDHGLTLKGCRFYDGAVRVPLIFSWPGMIRAGRVSDELTELTDIAPTIAEICGFPFDNVHGRSLMPLLAQNPDRAFVPREFVRCEYYDSQIDNGDSARHTYATMWRDRRYKLVTYHTADFCELYDMVEDPQETRNLWEEEGFEEKKLEVLKRSFDTSVIYSRPGQKRLGRY